MVYMRIVWAIIFCFTSNSYSHECIDYLILGGYFKPNVIRDNQEIVIDGVCSTEKIGALDVINSSVTITDIHKTGIERCPTLLLLVINSTLVINSATLPYDCVMIYARNSVVVCDSVIARKIVVPICEENSSVTLVNNTDHKVVVIVKDLPLGSLLDLKGSGQFDVYDGHEDKVKRQPLHGCLSMANPQRVRILSALNHLGLPLFKRVIK